MKQLENLNESDLIFYDIETARVVDQLEENTPLYEAWKYKTRYSNELNKKTGLEFTAQEYFHEKAALYAPFLRVVTIVVGRIKDNILYLKAYASYDEKELLEEFNKDLQAVYNNNPKVRFVSFNGVGFDTPALEKRSIINAVKPATLLSEGHLEPWKVTQIDLSKVWKGNAFYPDSLVAVATALGLPSPKDTLDGSQVSQAFYNGKLPEIVKYCLKDVESTARIFRKLSFLPDLNDECIVMQKNQEEKPLPLLERLYSSNIFSEDVKNELTEKLKDVLPEEKQAVKKIILAHYQTKKDKVGEKKAKEKEVDEFLNTL